MHDHGHDHGAGQANRRRLTITLALAASYMGVEVVGGLYSGSLALLADASHMLADVGALALALFASWFATRTPGPRWTYGFARVEILAALAQGAALGAVAVLIVVEALERMAAPTPVMGPWMLAIASGGLLVNVAGLWILNAGRGDSLNIRAAWLHVASDALGSVGAMVAGFLVWRFGWAWADPAASLVISVLVLASAWHVLRDAVDVLMEAAPRHLDLDEIRSALADLAEVSEVHDLHVWTVGSGEVCLSCHLVARDAQRANPILSEAYLLLGDRFGIDHATLQIESRDFAGQTPRSVCAHGCVTA